MREREREREGEWREAEKEKEGRSAREWRERERMDRVTFYHWTSHSYKIDSYRIHNFQDLFIISPRPSPDCCASENTFEADFAPHLNVQ